MPCELCRTNATRDWTHARSPGHLKKLKQLFKKIKKEEEELQRSKNPLLWL